MILGGGQLTSRSFTVLLTTTELWESPVPKTIYIMLFWLVYPSEGHSIRCVYSVQLAKQWWRNKYNAGSQTIRQDNL